MANYKKMLEEYPLQKYTKQYVPEKPFKIILTSRDRVVSFSETADQNSCIGCIFCELVYLNNYPG